MEIIWLSVLTAIVVLFIAYYTFSKVSFKKKSKYVGSQSRTFDNINQFLIKMAVGIPTLPKTQATEYEDKMHVKVVLTDRQAYWIRNNTLFVAEQTDGIIEKETTRPVDTMSMDKVELDKTAIIVQALTEGGENDYWSTRN